MVEKSSIKQLLMIRKEPETPTAEITPQHKDGKVEAEKTVNNPSPKLGEEIEYRISFKNTVENGN